MRHLFWFRHDLRLKDNTGLYAACKAGEVVPCLVLDDYFLKNNDTIGPNRCALFLRAAESLAADLKKAGSRLIVRHGRPENEIPKLMRESSAQGVYLNRDYEPYTRERDRRTERAVRKQGGTFQTFKDLVVFESEEILTQQGKPYTVFTQFKRNWLAQEATPAVLPAPRSIPFPRDLPALNSCALNSASITPESELPEITEQSARRTLKRFLDSAILDYARTRDLPGIDGNSHLSAHLKYGTLSPRTVIQACRELKATVRKEGSRTSIDTFISELVWRDFFFNVFSAFPHSANGPFRKKYASIKWENNPRFLEAWKAGMTGFPIVDAGLRQLKQTGWMHNRVRMITASFLCKDLLIDCREGERHFSRLLIDGEPAVNNGNWQWVAGTGTDAQPYFRIFNPTAQGLRFDPEGHYIRRWIPELASVPAKYIHSPEELPEKAPRYPRPIVAHSRQRQRALALYGKA